MEGYRFLMDNYLPGDKICLFGETFALAVRQISLNSRQVFLEEHIPHVRWRECCTRSVIVDHRCELLSLIRLRHRLDCFQNPTSNKLALPTMHIKRLAYKQMRLLQDLSRHFRVTSRWSS